MAEVTVLAERASTDPRPSQGWIAVWLKRPDAGSSRDHSIEWWIPVNGSARLCWRYGAQGQVISQDSQPWVNQWPS